MRKWIFQKVSGWIIKKIGETPIAVMRCDRDGKVLEEHIGSASGVTIVQQGWRARFYVNVRCDVPTNWEVYSTAGVALGKTRAFKTHRVEYPLLKWNWRKARWETRTIKPFAPLPAA